MSEDRLVWNVIRQSVCAFVIHSGHNFALWVIVFHKKRDGNVKAQIRLHEIRKTVMK